MQEGSPPPASNTVPFAAAQPIHDASDTGPHALAGALPADANQAGDSTARAGAEDPGMGDGAQDAGGDWDTGYRTLPRLATLTGQTATAWLRAAHAPYLVFAVAPVLVTTALLWARGARLSAGLLVTTALAAALAQAGAHLLDTYLDVVRAQQVATPASAPGTERRIDALLQTGIAPLTMFRVAVALLLVGACLGVPLALAGGVPALLLGGAGLLCALLYSATTYALKRLPLGELVVALAFGPGLVALTTLAQGQPVTPFALAVGVGLGLVAAAQVEAVNLRALAPDARDGRRTLMRLLGPARGSRFYAATFAAAYLVVVIAAIWQGAPHGALAVLFSLPVAILPITGALRARAAAALTLVVGGTLRAYVYFAFWIIMGLLLGGLYLHLLKLAGA